MKTNKEKFLELVSDEDTETLELIRQRIAWRPWIRVAQTIQLALIDYYEKYFENYIK
jgi:hypothetical protein